MKRKNKQILYFVQWLSGARGATHWDEWRIWGAKIVGQDFKQAFELYKMLSRTYATLKFRIISSNGFVRMKSHK